MLPVAHRDPRSWLAIASLGLCLLACWMLCHPYLGLAYDSTLYSLQALARVHPQSLATDVFLRFGSQDRYTLFSPLFASAIKLLDLEPAAALLTVTSQLGFFACAWLLARQVMSARLAVLAVGLLIALPSTYGLGDFFSYVESFLTPRQLAEALVLASLASALAARRLVAGICLIGALLLHPIMGFAGIVLFCCLYVAIPRPRLALVTGAIVLTGIAAQTMLLPVGDFAPFDAAWLQLVSDYTPYLFLSNWSVDGWSRASVAVAGLTIGALAPTSTAVRNLCRAALLTALCSAIVSLVCCDLLHVIIFTRMQAWRWLWLVEALSVLLLPVIVTDCWRAGTAGRISVFLLITTWVLRGYAESLYIASLTIAWALAGRRLRIPPRAGRLLLLGSAVALTVAMMINLATKAPFISLAIHAAAWTPVRAAQACAEDGVLCAAFVLLVWWLAERRPGHVGEIAPAIGPALLCLLLAVPTWHNWTHFHYTPTLRSAFAPWREAIPNSAQVIWPGTPVGAWYLLERPSYYSIHQVAGDIFSREKAIEIHRRAALLHRALDASGPTKTGAQDADGHKLSLPINADNLQATGLRIACSDPQLAFVVSWSHLGVTPFQPVVPDPGKPDRRLYLYRCADQVTFADGPDCQNLAASVCTTPIHPHAP